MGVRIFVFTLIPTHVVGLNVPKCPKHAELAKQMADMKSVIFTGITQALKETTLTLPIFTPVNWGR